MNTYEKIGTFKLIDKEGWFEEFHGNKDFFDEFFSEGDKITLTYCHHSLTWVIYGNTIIGVNEEQYFERVDISETTLCEKEWKVGDGCRYGEDICQIIHINRWKVYTVIDAFDTIHRVSLNELKPITQDPYDKFKEEVLTSWRRQSLDHQSHHEGTVAPLEEVIKIFWDYQNKEEV